MHSYFRDDMTQEKHLLHPTRTCLTWCIIYGHEASTILDGGVHRVLLHP
jgi:hypothetical protein